VSHIHLPAAIQKAMNDLRRTLSGELGAYTAINLVLDDLDRALQAMKLSPRPHTAEYDEYLGLHRSARPETHPIEPDTWASMSDASKIGYVQLLIAETHDRGQKIKEQQLLSEREAEVAAREKELRESRTSASFGSW
jgi:hypothetical protein